MPDLLKEEMPSNALLSQAGSPANKDTQAENIATTARAINRQLEVIGGTLDNLRERMLGEAPFPLEKVPEMNSAGILAQVQVEQAYTTAYIYRMSSILESIAGVI